MTPTSELLLAMTRDELVALGDQLHDLPTTKAVTRKLVDEYTNGIIDCTNGNEAVGNTSSYNDGYADQYAKEQQKGREA